MRQRRDGWMRWSRSWIPALILACCTQVFAADSDSWHVVKVPDAWRKLPKGELAPKEGFSWYRCLVEVPPDWKGAELTLYVEALDDARGVFVNGTRVGAIGTFPPQYRSGLGESGRFQVPADLIEPGRTNTIAIRVYQYDPRPNFAVAPPVLLNDEAKEGIRMQGNWQYRPGDDVAWARASKSDFVIDESRSGSEEQGLFAKIDNVEDVERYVSQREGDRDPLTPLEAEQAFTTPDDVTFQLVLSEPDIAQPLFMTWDARGRLWLMEYRQYPEIAGLKMISRDVFLRSVYDKVPPAPPNHDRGRDRISIHEDTDGDGVYDSHRVFVDGLNLASSCAIGHGGVWVTNPPYLLFYPDRDGDDVPDGDPEVHLEGFGIEDSHSVVNSLRFGPDGWLYGAQGSTVTGNVRRPGSKEPPVRTMGQCIWRYHPVEKRYEVFAEGGGNTFGVEINAKGHIFSGHNGGDTRGFHYIQGGYYRKGFGKHGPLSNPYAFGYFDNMKHHAVPRFTHNFVIYESPVLPEPYQGRLFGVEPLQGQVVMSDIQPLQSSFQTSDVSRPVQTDDQWFRPVDIKEGPDGCIYVADMYEQRIDHSSHYAGRIDRTNGRIYRLRPADEVENPSIDYTSLSSLELIDRLDTPNKWRRQTILRVLGDRSDADIVPVIEERLSNATGQYALELLWALHLSGGLNEERALTLLKHADQYVRAWTVRLLGDQNDVSAPIAEALVALARDEAYIEVRKQLASSARRLPAKDGVPILMELLKHDEDVDEIHQPLLVWWGLEAHAGPDGRPTLMTAIEADSTFWQRPLVKQQILERLMKRYALAGSREELLAAAELLELAPGEAAASELLKGFEEAYQGRSLANLPQELVNAIANSGGGSTALRVRQGDPDAIETAMAAVTDPKKPQSERLEFLQVFGEVRRPEFIPVLLQVVDNESDATLVSTALTALQPFGELEIGRRVVSRLDKLPGDARAAAESLLASRTDWALQLLQAVDAGDIEPDLITEATLRQILLHGGTEIQELISKHWGSVAGATTEEMRLQTERITEILLAASGNPKRGKPVYMQVCGKCHTLFGEGGQIGPDLTSFKRDQLERMLNNIINPSLEIREGFENYAVITTDGRVVNGFLADQDPQVVVLRGVDGQNLIIRRDEIEEMRAMPRSVMPEGTLKDLSDQQLRDLFAYLRSTQPVNY